MQAAAQATELQLTEEAFHERVRYECASRRNHREAYNAVEHWHEACYGKSRFDSYSSWRNKFYRYTGKKR